MISCKGNTLIEIIVSIGVFVIVATPIMVMVLGSHTGTLRSENRLEATAIAQQGVEAARAIRDYDWNDLTVGTHGLTRTSGYWEFSGASDTIGKYTRTVTVATVSAYKKSVVVTVTWDVTTGLSNSLTMTSRLTNWTILSWIQTLLADFDAGAKNSVVSTNISGGEVQLDQIGEFGSASIYTTYDFLGGGDVRDLFMDGDTLYVALKSDSSEQEFIALDVSDISNGNITELGSTELTTDPFAIHIYDGYAYIATKDNAAEVRIVRLSDYTQVNTIDISGGKDAYAIFAENDTLYVGRDNDNGRVEFYVYDITNPEASISSTSAEVEIGDDVTDIEIGGGYAYLATKDNSAEVAIIRLSDYSYVNSVNLDGNADAFGLHLVGTTLYLARDKSGEEEFYSLNVSSPEGTISTNGSTEIGDDANDVYVDGDRAYISTDAGGTEELAVVDLSDYSVEGRIDMNGTAETEDIWFSGVYIYAGSKDNTDTLQVLKSGLGGWSTPTVIDTYDSDEGLDGLDTFVSGDYAYMVTKNNGGGNDPEFYIMNISTPSNITLAGTYDVGADVTSVYVSGDYAYLATDINDKELLILDISNKANPSEAGSYDSDEGRDGLAVFVDGNTAYLGTANNDGNGDHELYVLNVTVKAAPVLLDSMEVGDKVNDIYVSGNYAYLATENTSKEFMVVDVSNTASVFETGSYDLDNDANGVTYDSNTAYVVTDNGGGDDDFFILDVSNPSSPGTYDVEDKVNDVYASGSYAYIAVEDGSNGFAVVDSSGTSYSVDVEDKGNGVYVSGNYAYVAVDDGSDGLAIVNVTVPTVPVLVTSVDVENKGNAVYVTNNKAYVAVADNNDGLAIVDVTNPLLPGAATSVDIEKQGQHVFADSTNAYVTVNDNNDGLAIVRLLDNDVTSIDVGGKGERVFVSGDYVYVAVDDDPNGLAIVKISTKTLVATVNVGGKGKDVYVSGNKAYVAVDEDDNGLAIVDVTNPESPGVAELVDITKKAARVTVSGSYVYLANENTSGGLTAVDVNNTSNIYTYNLSYKGQAVSISGTTAYVGLDDSNNGLAIVDVTDPSSPPGVGLTGSIDLGANNNEVSLDTSEDRAFIGNDENNEELKILDISTPASPSQSGSVDLDGDANGVYFANDYVHLATEEDDNEFQIVGPSTATLTYGLYGSFTSSAFNTGSSSTSWNTISWTESGTGTLQFQVRTANSEAGLASATWVGSDGTNSTYYTTSGSSITLDPGRSGTQWIQYRVEFSGDGSATPVLEDITFNYS